MIGKVQLEGVSICHAGRDFAGGDYSLGRFRGEVRQFFSPGGLIDMPQGLKKRGQVFLVSLPPFYGCLIYLVSDL